MASLRPVLEEEVEPGPHLTSDEDLAEWVKKVATTM